MEDFEDLIAKDGFVEHAKYGRNRYGTSKMTIEEQTAKGKVVVLDIEMEVMPTAMMISPIAQEKKNDLYLSMERIQRLTLCKGRQTNQKVRHLSSLHLRFPALN